MSDNLIFCPLECGVRIKNLTKHLPKCINFKLLGVKYKQCEYNSMHIIKNELYQIHLLSCNSKKKYEEDKSDKNDDDLAGKFSDDSDQKDENKNEQNGNNNKNKEFNDLENKNENENENDDNNPNKRKRRYRHERALFKNEEEIDQESLDFFNKVYI